MHKNSFLTQEAGPSGFQWWYFDAEFTNGYSTTLVILPYSIGSISGLTMNAQDPCVLVAITTPEGETYTARQSYSFSDLSASASYLDAHLGENSVAFDGKTYRLRFAEGDLKASLDITPTLPAWSPLGVNSDSRLDGSVMEIFGLDPNYFFDYLECMPRGTAKGYLEINNQKLDVEGIGYHEQGYGNFYLCEMIESWFWTKYYFEDYTLVFAGIRNETLLDGFEISGLMLAQKNSIIKSYMTMSGSEISIKNEAYNTHEETGESFPSRLQFNIDIDNLKMTGQINYLFLRDSWGFNYPEDKCNPIHKPTWLQYTSETEFEMELNGRAKSFNTRGVYECMISG